MFLFQEHIHAKATTIRGIQYVVVSNYEENDFIFNRIGTLIETEFQREKLFKCPEKFENSIAKIKQ